MASPAVILLPLGFILSLTPLLNGATALVLGVAIALTVGNPYSELTRRWTKPLLSTAIIGLGAGMNLLVVLDAGLNGIAATAAGLASVFLLGAGLARLLGISRDLALLLNAGTAICGGSAIAAVAGVIKPKAHETSMALAIVFLLNALGLLIFPWLGHQLGLTQDQFGVWAALAIHDTSSVVGAAAQYGARALEIGTTVKLTRALWIVPVTLLIARFYGRGQDTTGRTKAPPFPWFIAGFLAASLVVTAIPALQEAGHFVEGLSRHLLAATLFLIGCGFTRGALKELGFKPVLHAVILWIVTAGLSLAAVQGAVVAANSNL